jgi:hypothetical protein
MKIMDFELDTLGFSHFKKLINLIMPAKERRQSSIIIKYLGIYTQLNNAFNLLNKSSCRRAFEHLRIAKNMMGQDKFDEEQHYMKRISAILNSLLKNKDKIIEGIIKEEASDPFHAKTSVMLAENICILRILKINKY